MDTKGLFENTLVGVAELKVPINMVKGNSLLGGMVTTQYSIW